jgi:predicted RNase H-like HicB family nuclease
MKYSVTLVESDEGWAVWCDSLPGCCSQGATREEALANIRDAISEYLEAKLMVKEGESGVHVQHEEITV